MDRGDTKFNAGALFMAHILQFLRKNPWWLQQWPG